MSTQPTFKIEKGIPAPQSMRERAKYPFREMEVGDSFFLACERDSNKERALRTRAYSLNRGGRRHQVSRVEGGVRVWRVA